VETDKMKKVILFGAGARTPNIIRSIKSNIKLVCIVDNDNSKWHKNIDGIKVCSPEIIKEIDFEIIFIIPFDYFLIQQQLLDLGVDVRKIYNSTHLELICNETDIIKYASRVVTDKQSIIAFSHALSSTGAQNVLATCLFEYQKMGFKIIVISQSDGELRKTFVDKGIEVLIIRDLYTHVHTIGKMISKSKLVIINTLWLYYVALDICHYGGKTIWWIHESINLEYINPGVFKKCIDKNIDIYAVSETVRDAILELTLNKINVGILRFGLREYKIYKKEHEKINFVVLAAISYIKGQDLFIEAVKRLPEDIKAKANFYIIGGGQRTEEMLCAAKMADVKILDQVFHDEISKVYEMADIIVCPSRKEAMSVTVVEGWMHYKPAIVSSAAGVSRYIDDMKGGVVFETDNIDALKESIIFMIRNKKALSDMGNAGNQIFKKYFSIRELDYKLKELICDGEDVYG